MLPIIRIIFTLLGLCLFLAIPLWVGIWIFRPVDQAAKDREHPTQFTIIDFFCLFFIIQLAMAIIHWQFGLEEEATVDFTWILDIFFWFACGVLWMKSVQLMSRAGIQRPMHRVLFLAFIIPTTLVGSLAAPALLMYCFVAIFDRPAKENFYDLPVMFIVFCLIWPILYISAKSTRRIVAAAEPSTPELAEAELAEEIA